MRGALCSQMEGNLSKSRQSSPCYCSLTPHVYKYVYFTPPAGSHFMIFQCKISDRFTADSLWHTHSLRKPRFLVAWGKCYSRICTLVMKAKNVLQFLLIFANNQTKSFFPRYIETKYVAKFWPSFWSGNFLFVTTVFPLLNAVSHYSMITKGWLPEDSFMIKRLPDTQRNILFVI